MLKVAIIGCGKIADQHAAIITSMKNCCLAGVCDNEPLMAMQLGERFNVKNRYSEVEKMLNEVMPDVVHITTPPQSHYPLGKLCLEKGSHIYVEKPFTLNVDEATSLFDIAKKRSLKITVGHNLQFSHASRRMRQLINSGFLGGKPIHMESYYCYDLSDPKYAKAVLGDKDHWVRKLPGKLLHNLISHGIAKIAEFIDDDDPKVDIHSFRSSILESTNETEIVDEVRVIIHSKSKQTAYFTCSTQMKPCLRYFRIFGNSNGIEIDENSQVLLRRSGKNYKSFLNNFVPSLIILSQCFENMLYNLNKFIICEFHNDAGMRFLIQAFYRSIAENTKTPIPEKEIILTTKIMERIFCKVN